MSDCPRCAAPLTDYMAFRGRVYAMEDRDGCVTRHECVLPEPARLSEKEVEQWVKRAAVAPVFLSEGESLKETLRQGEKKLPAREAPAASRQPPPRKRGAFSQQMPND